MIKIRLIKIKLKFFVRRFPVFVRLLSLFRTINRKEGWLPNNNSKFFITSWGRSANSFLYWVMRELFPEDIHIASHGHSIGSLRIAQKQDVPIIASFRSPDKTVASMMSKQNAQPYLTELYLNDWISYHDWLLSNSSICKLILFEDLINNPIKIISPFCINDSSFSNTLENAIELARNRLENDNRPEATRNLSSINRRVYLDEVASEIRSLESYSLANRIYENLLLIREIA